jgi:hypothetical protein
MNRVLSTFTFLLLTTAVAAVLGACDSGPTCVENPVVRDCDPVCDVTATPPQVCNDGTCVDLQTCTPDCDTATQFCNSFTGACENLPASCSPSCAAGEFCDDGTCRDVPVCDPPCPSGEHCE